MKKLFLTVGAFVAAAFLFIAANVAFEDLKINSGTRNVVNPGVVNFATGKLKVNNAAVVGGGGNGFQSVSVSAAGNTNSSQATSQHVLKLSAAAGAGTYTATVALPTTGRTAGDNEDLHLSFAASTNPTVEIHNNTSGGTLLFNWTGDGAATEIEAQCVFDGSAWYVHDAHFVW